MPIALNLKRIRATRSYRKFFWASIVKDKYEAFVLSQRRRIRHRYKNKRRILRRKSNKKISFFIFYSAGLNLLTRVRRSYM